MFAQVITGTLKDRSLFEEREAIWRSELRPTASGFLGSTSGVTSDGTFVLVARFESEASARLNSERPEQVAWFEGTAKAFDGTPSFRDSSDVQLVLGGGSDVAGFVQVIDGRTSNEAELRKVLESAESELKTMRPDLLGVVVVWHGDGAFTEVVYFASLDEARRNEASMSDDPTAQRLTELLDGPMTFYDLTEPTFA